MDFTPSDYELINKEFEELKKASLKRCVHQEEFDEIVKAFNFANEAHKGVRRRSGEPYIIHPIAVAKIVVSEIGLGYKSIVTALLHDVVEDTEYTVDDIKRLFGEKIASLVDGLTKIKAAFDSDNTNLQAENFKRIILTLNDDVRVVLIKLADRLHNIRTIESMPDYKREKILSETMYVFIPLASRLGLYSIKTEMENIWFRYVQPQEYAIIKKELDLLVEKNRDSIEEFKNSISKILEKNKYNFTIIDRVKTPYSIWRKKKTKGIEDIDAIFDIFAVRIVFEPKSSDEVLANDEHGNERIQCWNIYSLITNLYIPRIERIRDWISRPKSNGYEALHCTFMNKGKWVEVQIRTLRMDEIAEKGIAAHWTYKGVRYDNHEMNMDQWLSMVREILENSDASAVEFLDHFRENLLTSEISVFTPKGQPKNLPKGSTVLDFAYLIHSEIGDKAIASKVNQRLAPLSHVLNNGDQVEIITSESNRPSRDWLDFLVTPKAIARVNSALNVDTQKQIKGGIDLLNSILEELKTKSNKQILESLISEFNLSSKEDLYKKIYLSKITKDDIQKIIKKNTTKKNQTYWTLHLLKGVGDKSNKQKKKIELKDLGKNREYILEENSKSNTVSYKVDTCCHPIPGDKVIGFLGEDGEVTIHISTCPKATELASKEGNKIVTPTWKSHSEIASLVTVRVAGLDRLGILHELTEYSNHVDRIIFNKVVIETHDGLFEGFFDCSVFGTDDLQKLMDFFKKIKGVKEVSRVN